MKVIEITKTGKHQIDVPILPKKYQWSKGIYTIIFKGTKRKIGIFGTGKSGGYERFSSYRTVGQDISKVQGNGSYKTMKILNEKLKVGEKASVHFQKVPEDRIINGIPYIVDLYKIERELQEKSKNLWLK